MEDSVRSGGCLCGAVRYTTYEGSSFCPRCGSRLFIVAEEAVELQLGSLDDAPFELRPEAEIWIKRREPWMHPVEGASQHHENRPR